MLARTARLRAALWESGSCVWLLATCVISPSFGSRTVEPLIWSCSPRPSSQSVGNEHGDETSGSDGIDQARAASSGLRAVNGEQEVERRSAGQTADGGGFADQIEPYEH
jgi:hypothetical protein